MSNKSIYLILICLSLALFGPCKACEPSGKLYIIVIFTINISNLIWIYWTFYSTPGDLRWFSIKNFCVSELPDAITPAIKETYENGDLVLYGVELAIISQLLPTDGPNDFRVCAWWKVPEKTNLEFLFLIKHGNFLSISLHYVQK